jgi:hypothetical protein
MKFFFRYLLPITYFQATRLNRLELVAYNALIEWIPAIAVSLYLNNWAIGILVPVLISYIAFISIYEIGYITNDQLSEKFEDDPRGRANGTASSAAVGALIIARLTVFILCTWTLAAWANTVWWVFHATLALSFLLHNLLAREYRIATFFSLSTYRFFAPIILTVDTSVLVLLLPPILLNNSVYRLSVYLDSKNLTGRQSMRSKFAFYLACLPLGLLFSLIYSSLIPVAITLYFLTVWLGYFSFTKLTGRDLRG